MKLKKIISASQRILHFQPSSGLSGDMILAALLDLGVNHKEFKETMAKLNLGVKLKISEVKRASLRGRRVEVIISEKKRLQERKWDDIKNLISSSPFSPQVKEKALAIFQALFQAEAKVHGRPLSEIHLHEVGADDALVDVIGSCWLLEKLNVEIITCAPINLGSGWVKTSHGLLPVPPPAVSEILKGIPVYSFGPEVELTTPTGAAIIATLTSHFLIFPEIIVNRVGYGAGRHDFPQLPNILRVFLGQSLDGKKPVPLYEINTNIDDTTPQVIAYTCEKLLQGGALDVFQTPIFMKKGRLATQLTVLVEADKMDKVIDILFKETTTLGLRYHPIERRILERIIETVEIEGEKIPVKIARVEDKIIQVHPEYEACRKLAEKKGLSLRKSQDLVMEYWKKQQQGWKRQ
ncbi:MAG: nickel pincer cofactor biosynthesis protein LarC [Candidatus Aminicenantes bacterium]|nr:nickel pincer cofactor biosynthesis protein LarC [Candidatus Aminicenantes bacterium]